MKGVRVPPDCDDRAKNGMGSANCVERRYNIGSSNIRAESEGYGDIELRALRSTSCLYKYPNL